MGYRVILLKNGEYKKTMYKSKTRESAFIRYNSLKKENKKVLFPKRYINYNGICEVKYKLLIVKDIEEGDKNRFVRDELGKLYEEKPLEGIWTILDSSDYDIEETFWVYGFDPKKERKTIHDIIKILMKGAYKKKMVKEIIVVHNKLIIYSEEHFEMVICKNKEDAQRLLHRLKKATVKSKIKSLVFLGTATPATVSQMYEIIHEKTGWPYTKIRRTTTRP